MSFFTLIRPSMVVLRLVQSRSTCPPLGVAYLAGSLKAAGHQVDVIDAVGEAIFQILPFNEGKDFFHGLTLDAIVDRVDSDSDYLGVSCMFTIEWPLVRQLLTKLRARFPDKPIIIGGEHVTATSDWIMKNHPEVDYCVLGEGESKLVHLIHALDNGLSVSEVAGVVSKENSRKPERAGSIDRYLMGLRIEDVDDIPLPAWDLIPIQQYIDNGFGYGVDRGRNMPMLATRGCPYQCTFCSSPQMWTTKWLAREPAQVLDEMQGYIERYGAENFSFYDLTAIVKREWIITFCKLILERGLKFSWQLPSGTRSEAIDDEVAYYLYQTGCRNLNYAPESGSKRTLQSIKKKVNLESMKKSMRSCLKNGLVVKSNTIMGFPGETHRDIWQTLKWVYSIALLGVHEVTVTMYIPYPGTEIFDYLRSTGKIPEFTDEYFNSLATRGNFFANKSFSENISDRTLSIYIMFAMLGTTFVCMMRRPGRYFGAIRNVLFNKSEESRMEASFRVVVRQFKHLFSSKRSTPYLATRKTKSMNEISATKEISA